MARSGGRQRVRSDKIERGTVGGEGGDVRAGGSGERGAVQFAGDFEYERLLQAWCRGVGLKALRCACVLEGRRQISLGRGVMAEVHGL